MTAHAVRGLNTSTKVQKISTHQHQFLILTKYHPKIRHKITILAPATHKRHAHQASAAPRFNISRLYCLFISSGKKEAFISSNHLGTALRNFLSMLPITLPETPDAMITFTKSVRCSLRFFPFSVKANSSSSSGMTIAVEIRS